MSTFTVRPLASVSSALLGAPEVWRETEPSGSVDALASRGIIQPGLARVLFDERMGEHASYYGEMIWILMMLEQWLKQHPASV